MFIHSGASAIESRRHNHPSNRAFERLRTTIGAIAVATAVITTSALAQGNGNGGAGGVFVDADGVVRFKQVVARNAIKKNLAAKKLADGNYGEVSLKRIIQATEGVASTGELPAEKRLLNGLVKIEFLLVDADAKDLLLIGPTDSPVDVEATRPIGIRTRRPLIRLDDLLMALRTFEPKKGVFGCSIDMTQEHLNAIRESAAKIGSTRRGALKQAATKIGESAGLQDVRIFGTPDDSNYAFVCVEADVLMKRLALGLDKSPVKGVVSQLSAMKPNESIYCRFWFEPKYAPLTSADDGSGYQIDGQSMMVKASGSMGRDDSSAPASGIKFAESVTEHFDELASRIPSFADLVNLTDLAVVAMLIREDGLDDKAGLRLDRLRDEAFATTKSVVPKNCESLFNYRATGQTLIVAVGGVSMNVRKLTARNDRKPISGVELKERIAARKSEAKESKASGESVEKADVGDSETKGAKGSKTEVKNSN